MGGCVGTHSGGRRNSGSASGLSDSSLAPVTKNKPLKPDKMRWKSDIPLTDGQLMSKRDEFWDTAPAFEGRNILLFEILNVSHIKTFIQDRNAFRQDRDLGGAEGGS